MTSTYTNIADGNPGDQFTDKLFTDLADNDDFLRNPPRGTYALSTGGANLTTASASFTDLSLFTVTLTTQGNPVDMEFNARVNTANARFDFLVDGASITADNDGLGAPAGISTFAAVSIRRRISVTAGVHSFKVQWRSTSGTITLYAPGLGQLNVVECG